MVIVETAPQAASLVGERGRGGVNEREVIALAPAAAYELERRGITHRSLRHLVSRDEIDALGVDHLDRLDQITAIIDRSLEEAQVPGLAAMKVKPGALAWFEFKRLLNSVGFRGRVLSKLLAERPKSLACFSVPPVRPRNESLLVAGSLWSLVARRVCETQKVPCQWLPEPWRFPDIHRARARWRRSVPDALRWRGGALLRASRFIGWGGAIQLRSLAAASRAIDGPVIMFLSPGMNLPHVLAGVLAGARLCPGFLNGVQGEAVEVWLRNDRDGWFRRGQRLGRRRAVERGETRHRLRRGWDELARSPDFRALWQEGSLDFFDLVEEWIGDFMCAASLDLVDTYLRTSEALEILRPRAMIVEVMGSAPVKASVLAARQAGIPVLVYRHGTSLAYLTMEARLAPEEYRNDVVFADKLLCWGEGDARFFRRWSEVDAMPVGSAHLDALRSGRRRGEWEERRRCQRGRLGIEERTPAAVYVLQNLVGEVFSNPYRYRLPDVEWEIERAIVAVFREFPEIALIVKLHPDRQFPVPPLPAWTRDVGMKNVRFVRDEAMADLLAAGDLFISDYPTTSFLEMLTTDKPVFVCGHDLPTGFFPGAELLPMWEERVVFAKDLPSFLDTLRAALSKGVFRRPSSGDDLLRHFGIHLDDGGSAQRVIEALEAEVR
jgi:hypothetical protein